MIAWAELTNTIGSDIKFCYLYLLRGHEELLPAVHVGGLGVLPAEVLRHLPGGELCLADVPKISSKMDGFPLHQGGKQGDVGSLPPACREGHPQLVQLVTEMFSSILGFCSS